MPLRSAKYIKRLRSAGARLAKFLLQEIYIKYL
jgi:hypothetical protein